MVTVENGSPASIVYVADGQPATNTAFQRADTIDELFQIIHQAIDDGVDRLNVQYDPTYGYPTTINIDPRADAVDEESAYFVSELRIGK